MFVIFIHIVFAFDSNIGIVRIFQNEVYRTFAVPVCDRIPPDNALLTATGRASGGPGMLSRDAANFTELVLGCIESKFRK